MLACRDTLDTIVQKLLLGVAHGSTSVGGRGESLGSCFVGLPHRGSAPPPTLDGAVLKEARWPLAVAIVNTAAA